ncbi:MAG: hypothetical protein ABI273_04925 [Lacunisphaera sp.]
MKTYSGKTHRDRPSALRDSLPAEQQQDSVPGSAGRQVPELPNEDEDDEGRSETEQLVDQGAIDAARNSHREAARAIGQMIRQDDASRPVPPPNRDL